MLKTNSGQPSGARPPTQDTSRGHSAGGEEGVGGPPQATSVGSEAGGGGADHWSGQVIEAVVSVGGEGGITVLGGSDNGEFPYLGEISPGVRYQQGGPSLAPGAVLLEVQGQRVAGYTQRDVVAWINHCTRNGNPCVIRTAPPGRSCFLVASVRSGVPQGGMSARGVPNQTLTSVTLECRGYVW